MTFRTAIALIALAAPVFAQHGGHAGSFGGRGSAGHAGFSASRSFSRSFAPSAPSAHYGAPLFRYNVPAAHRGFMGEAGFRGSVPRRYSGSRTPYRWSSHIPYSGSRFGSGRAPYHRSNVGSRGGEWDRGGNHDRDHDRFDRRRHEFNTWYNYSNPYWLGYGYPYVIDPGFYDWDDNDSGESEQPSDYNQAGNGYDQGGAAPAYQPPYPDEGFRRPYQQPAAPTVAAVSAPLPKQQQLTVIFKDGRAPVNMQNYMMTPRVLTDLDPQ
ncbi:MAG: hypothetical protein ACRD3S_06955, partial [Terracidiphilus sp.]